MAGLALKLAPNEQVMINGVIVENGPRRTQLLIKSEGAAVLRLRDALDEADVIGPVSRAYFIAQRAVAGQIGTDEAAEELAAPLAEVERLARGHATETATIRQALGQRNLYRVMRALKPLLDLEREPV